MRGRVVVCEREGVRERRCVRGRGYIVRANEGGQEGGSRGGEVVFNREGREGIKKGVQEERRERERGSSSGGEERGGEREERVSRWEFKRREWVKRERR